MSFTYKNTLFGAFNEFALHSTDGAKILVDHKNLFLKSETFSFFPASIRLRSLYPSKSLARSREKLISRSSDFRFVCCSEGRLQKFTDDEQNISIPKRYIPKNKRSRGQTKVENPETCERFADESPVKQAAYSNTSLERAKEYSLRLVVGRLYTCAELQKKLENKGHSSEDIQTVISQLQANGSLNDREYSQLFAQMKWRVSKWAPRRMKMALRAKGVIEEDIDFGISEMMRNKLEIEGEEEGAQLSKYPSLRELHEAARSQWMKTSHLDLMHRCESGECQVGWRGEDIHGMQLSKF